MVPSHGQDAEHEMLQPNSPSHTYSKTSRQVRSWKVAASLTCSIIVGILFGLIHHFFYAFWDGRVVSSDAQQRWIIRGGTAFAFGLKTALTLGTGVAYVQYLFLTLSSRQLQVGKINSLFQILGNAFEFIDLALWLHVPILAILAAITWTLPIAAIVTPGTLTVVASSGNTTQNLGVPQFDYRDYTKYAATLPEDNAAFSGAADDLVRLALGSAATQSILPIAPPAVNSTYSINMYAPALSCQNAYYNDTRAIEAAYYNFSSLSGGAGIIYMGWVPTGYYPCANGSFTTPTDFTGSTTPDTIDGCHEGYSSKIYIYIPFRVTNTAAGSVSWDDPVMLNCSLRNASYALNFDFRNRAQTVNVSKRELVNGVVGLDSYDVLLASKSEDNVTLANTLLSYQSIMDAFGRLIVGTITTYHYGTTTPVYTLVQSTGLKRLLPATQDDLYYNHTTTNATLGRAVENLFENITLSLLSSKDLTVDFSNTTAAAAIPLTTVTTFFPQNVYKYEAQQLWLAYGIAILTNVLCLLVGVFAIRRNGHSYSSDFTTILRTTRSPNLDLLVANEESNGAQPVARKTKTATLTYLRSNEHGWAGFDMKSGQYPQAIAQHPISEG